MSNYLRAGLVDELHLAVVPILLGDGEGLFANSTAARPATGASGSSLGPDRAEIRFGYAGLHSYAYT